MSEHDEYRHRLGAYVIGALDSVERDETEEHLTGCDACRDELSMLSPLLAALARIPSPDLVDPGSLVASDSNGPVAAAALHVIELRARRSRIRTAGIVGLGAAIVTGVAIVVGSGGTPAPTPARTLTLHAISGASGSDRSAGSAELDAREWGTQIVLTLEHLPALKEFVASISGPNGTQVVGTWGSTRNGRVVVQLGTSVRPDAVGSLVISTSAGTVVLHT